LISGNNCICNNTVIYLRGNNNTLIDSLKNTVIDAINLSIYSSELNLIEFVFNIIVQRFMS